MHLMSTAWSGVALATETAAKAASNGLRMDVDWWEWIILAVIIVAMILWDLLGHVRKPHEPTIKEAAIWSVFYIAVAIIFGFLLMLHHPAQFTTEYFAGYITEKSLSLDNIFVFIIIIAAFQVPRAYQQKVLMWGIIIALVLRLIFILVGAVLIERFVWVFFIFGAWMLYTAIGQIKDGVDELNAEPEDEEEAFEPNWLVKFASKHFHVTPGYEGYNFFVKKNGQTWITPLFLCILAIGSVDLMFALDSIPAIYGLTSEPFIVFAANAFALLGLRQLFFLIDGLLEKLIYLHFGLAIILGFIAVKLVLRAFHGYDLLLGIPEPSTGGSVLFILGTIVLTVIASLIKSRSDKAKSA